MKNLILITGLLIIASSCSMNSPEMVKQQITIKKAQVENINEQIALLESQVEPDSTIVDKGVTVSVALQKLEPHNFEHYIEITGKLEAEKDAFISPEMNGQIKKIYVAEGQKVKKGQLLLALNTSMIESNIREVKSGLTLTSKLYEKQKELWDQEIGSEMQFLEAKNAKESTEARLATLQAQLDMARVKAPFAGVIETIMLKEGELAAPGMQVIQLVSLDNLKLYGDISERYLTNIQKGDEVFVSFPDIEEISLSVPIHRVGNVIDDKSRTFRIEMKIDNAERRFKPNMYTTIRVNDFSSDSAFVVPAVIIKQDVQGNYLYVSVPSGIASLARKRYVDLGLSYNDRTMIASGLATGDDVIVKGYTQVSDGVLVEVK